MSGFLFHARSFRSIPYIGRDGLTHHEIEAVGGDCEGISYRSWEKLKEICDAFGVPREVWPEYLGHDYAIDIPVSEVVERQKALRNALESLTSQQIGTDPLLTKIKAWIRNDESVFFC